MRAEVGLAWRMSVHGDASSAEDIRKYNPLPVLLVTEGSRLIQDQQITALCDTSLSDDKARREDEGTPKMWAILSLL
jgi:hypothetical protein